MEKLPLTARGSGVRLRTRTFRNVKFIILKDRNCTDVYDTIMKLSNPSMNNLVDCLLMQSGILNDLSAQYALPLFR